MKIAIVVWVALTIVVSGASGVVLCIGEDGHLALELLHDGECRDDEKSSRSLTDRSPEALSSAATSSNGGCVDLTFSTDSLLRFSKTTKSSHLLKQTATRLLPYGGQPTATACLLASHAVSQRRMSPNLNTRLFAQRNVVLRI